MAIAINTSEDIIRALREDPHLLDQARRAILTDDLLGMPEVQSRILETQNEMLGEIAELKRVQSEILETQSRILETQNEMLGEIAELKRAQSGMLETQTDLLKAQNELLRRVGNVETRFTRFEDGFGRFRGNYAEVAARKDAFGIVMALNETRDAGFDETSTRVLSQSELGTFAREYGTDKVANIPISARRSYYKTDVMIEVAKRDGSICYVVVQASYTCNGRDTRRVASNAELVGKFTGKEVWPTVAGVRMDNRIRHVIENGEVSWYPLDDREVMPKDPV